MREWYFVVHRDNDALERDVYEVQILDDDGRGIEMVVFHEATEVAGRVPPGVIQAAMEREIGPGDYVGPDGASVAPF